MNAVAKIESRWFCFPVLSCDITIWPVILRVSFINFILFTIFVHDFLHVLVNVCFDSESVASVWIKVL